MKKENTGPSSISPSTERVFLEFLEASPDPSQEDWEILRKKHPLEASEVESLFKDWVWLEQVCGIAADRERPSSSDGSESTDARLDRLVERAIAKGDDDSRYRIVGNLGRGGMGIVLEVEDLDLKRRLAMKVAGASRSPQSGPAATSRTRRALSRFLEEAQITGQLDHPGVVPIHDLGVDAEGHVFFTMKKVGGEELGEIFRLARAGNKGWNQQRALGVLVKICQTIAYAHSKGVVHRDLKPSNVMVGQFGEAYVLDWGLAKLLAENGRCKDDEESRPDSEDLDVIRTDRRDELETTPDSPLMTVAGAVLGTPYYMSPEQASGDPLAVGPFSDIYALGAILYSFLADQRPYEDVKRGGQQQDIVEKINRGEPVAVDRINPDAHPELVAICSKAMTRDPKKRYSSALDMAEDLEAHLDGRAVAAHRIGPLVDLQKWVRRNRFIAAASLVILVFVVVTPSALMVQENRAKRAIASERKEALLQSYIASMSAAEAALRINDVPEARRQLEAAPASLRNWEWHHFYGRLDQSDCTLEFGSWIRSLSFGPDGELLAVAYGNMIEVWDTEKRTLVHSFEGHEGLVHAVKFLSKQVLISGSEDGSVKKWSLKTGGEVGELFRSKRGSVPDIALHPERHSLAIAVGPEVRVIDVVSGREILVIAADRADVISLTYNHGGDRILTSASGVCEWNAETGRLVRRLDRFPGKVRAFYDRSDESIVSISHGVQTFGREDRVESHYGSDTDRIAFGLSHPSSPNKVLLAGEDRSLRWWDTKTEKVESIVRGHEKPITALAVSPKGKIFVSGGFEGAVKFWSDSVSSDVEVLRGHPVYVQAVAWDLEGRRLASAGWDYVIKVWDAESAIDIGTYYARHHVHDVAFNPGGNQLAVGTRSPAVCFVDLSTGAVTRCAEVTGWVDSVVYSLSGRWLASGSSDGTILIWDPDAMSILRVLEGNGSGITDLVFSPDEGWLVSASTDGEVKLWQTSSWSAMSSSLGAEDSILSLCFSPDGSRLFGGSTGGSIQIWEIRGMGLVPLRREKAHSRGVTSLSFTPDGSRLASGARDRSILIWDVESMKVVARLLGHSWWVNSVSFSPSGATLASASKDRTVRLWEQGRSVEEKSVRKQQRILREEVAARLDQTNSSDMNVGERLEFISGVSFRGDDERRAMKQVIRAEGNDPRRLAWRTWRTLLDSGSGSDAWSRSRDASIIALGLDTEVPLYLRNLGAARIRCGDSLDGVMCLEDLVRSEAKGVEEIRPGALVFLAMGFVDLGRADEALDALDEAERFLSRDDDCWQLCQQTRKLAEQNGACNR